MINAEKSIVHKLKDWKEVISAISTIGSVAVAIILFGSSYLLSPLVKDVTDVKFRVQAIEETSVSISKFNSLAEQLKQRDDDIIHRLDLISERLDKSIFR